MRSVTTLLLLFPILLPAQESKLPEGPGRSTTARLCTSCHGIGIFTRRRESRDGWNTIIEEMIRRGAKGEEAEWAEVSDYLFAQFSNLKINVNRATAEQLADKLSLSPEQAAAIVAYRERNGRFKTIEDLQKVPGLDADSIHSKLPQIDF